MTKKTIKALLMAATLTVALPLQAQALTFSLAINGLENNSAQISWYVLGSVRAAISICVWPPRLITDRNIFKWPWEKILVAESNEMMMAKPDTYNFVKDAEAAIIISEIVIEVLERRNVPVDCKRR